MLLLLQELLHNLSRLSQKDKWDHIYDSDNIPTSKKREEQREKAQALGIRMDNHIESL